MTATALQLSLSAAEAFVEIVARNISIVPALGGKLWAASADIKGNADHNRKRAIRSETVIASSPLRAVEQLVARLGANPEQQQLWEDAA